MAAIRSAQLDNSSKNLDMYDSFISICGRDYERSHKIAGDLMFLQANFAANYGSLENIQKTCPSSTSSKANTHRSLLAPLEESKML